MEAERARAEDLADRLGERPRNSSFLFLRLFFVPVPVTHPYSWKKTDRLGERPRNSAFLFLF
jgi:hypothetical protein